MTFAVLVWPSAAFGQSSLRDRVTGLGFTCEEVSLESGGSWIRCDGEIPSFDGIGLRTTIGLPPGAEESLPTVSLFHGWLLGGRQEFLPSDVDGRDHGPFNYHWNVPWFASRGYVAVAATTRGVAASCGMSDLDPKCVSGYLHLSERDYEVRDAQHVLGTLVDAGIADPDRLAGSGGSLGGGMSWLLATSFPWDTPAPGKREIKLAAAVPQVGWTDLLASLAPNGRATDDAAPVPNLGMPFGIPKTSTIGGLLALSRVDPGIPAPAFFGQSARYNETNPGELHSHLTSQAAIVFSGEPYDPRPDPARLVEAYRNKSPYYANAWFEALAAGQVETVPTFAVSGWMDTHFPAVETLQMYRRLLAADPKYPIELAFGGFGHKSPEDRLADWIAINDAANAFLDEALGIGPQVTPRPAVRAFVSQCSPGSPGPHVAASWDALTTEELTFRGATTQQTSSATQDDQDAAHNPQLGPICNTESRTESPDAEWQWDVGPTPATMVGLARVTANYTLSGSDATVIAKLWDVSPDGTRAMVDRGVYRIATAAGDPTQGRLDFELFGSSWNFEPGHEIQLELAQTDGVAFRPDNLPSTIEFSDVALTVPTVGSGHCTNKIVGTSGSDLLRGTSGSDHLLGRRGADTVSGRAGDDCLRGGRGRDRLRGGGGDDVIRARRGGRDRIRCGSGDDAVYASAARDVITESCEKVRAR